MKSDRIAVVKKNIEQQVKNSKLDKAMVELEKVTDIMEDYSCKEGWLICKLCTRVGNAIITRQLERNNHFKAISYLRKVEKALNVWENRVEFYLETKVQQGEPEDLFELIITTRNNFSLLHKLQGKQHKALDQLLQAIKITKHLEDSTNPEILKSISRTFLNTSAIYYEVRKYDLSVNYAKNCLEFLTKELSLRKDIISDISTKTAIERYLETSEAELANLKGSGALNDDGVQEAFTTIVLIYQNIGVSQEALKNHEEASHYQEVGSSLARQWLREDNQIRKLVEDVQLRQNNSLKHKTEVNTDDLNIDEKQNEWQKRTEESNIIKNSSLDKFTSSHNSLPKGTSEIKRIQTADSSQGLNGQSLPHLNQIAGSNAQSATSQQLAGFNNSGVRKNSSEVNANRTSASFNPQKYDLARMRREVRPKSAVRFVHKPNISKQLDKLLKKVDNIKANSENQWKVNNITGVEVEHFTQFLKSQGMNEKNFNIV